MFWSVSPSVDMLPFGVTIPATTTYTAEVGNPGRTYELPCTSISFLQLDTSQSAGEACPLPPFSIKSWLIKPV